LCAIPRKDQQYCSKKSASGWEKRWHEKMKAAGLQGQQEGQQCWMEQNQDYWRYRANHPQYVERNRLLQKGRDQKRRRQMLAKMDASQEIYPVKPGTYYLIPAKGDPAKMDPISHKYFVIPDTYPFLAKKDSMDLRFFPEVDCGTKEATTHDRKSHPLSRPGS
jgi:hypothetical protein